MPRPWNRFLARRIQRVRRESDLAGEVAGNRPEPSRWDARSPGQIPDRIMNRRMARTSQYFNVFFKVPATGQEELDDTA